jgi:hypothetical protein
MEYNIAGGKSKSHKEMEKNLLQCHFIRYENHFNFPGTEPGSHALKGQRLATSTTARHGLLAYIVISALSY